MYIVFVLLHIWKEIPVSKKMKSVLLNCLGVLGVFAAVAVVCLLAYASYDDSFDVPCMTDGGTMSHSPTVCEKYGR